MTDEPKKQIADHDFLDAEGNVTKDITEAVGYRYTDKASGEVAEVNWNNASEACRRMGWLFGMKTKATNEASQWRQKFAKGEIDDDDGSQVDQILDTFALIEKGTWREKVEGRGVGAKVDRDLLAAVIVEIMGVDGKGNPLDLQVVRERLDDDTKFFRAARAHEKITAAYNERKGIKPKAAPDLGSLL